MREIVGWETNPDPNGQFHVAFFDESGFNGIDVWDSPEAFQNFVDTRLMPGIAGGVDGEPTVTITPAHAVFSLAAVS